MIQYGFAFLFAVIAGCSLAVCREVYDRSVGGRMMTGAFLLVAVIAGVTAVMLFRL